MKTKYFIIPINGYDVKTTMESIEKTTGCTDIEILKSEDMTQVLKVPNSCDFENSIAFVLTSEYLCTENPDKVWEEMEERNPFMYSPSQKVFCIQTGHNHCKSHFGPNVVNTPHIATYLDFSLSSAHIYKESSTLDNFFTRRGIDMIEKRRSDLKLDRESLEKVKEATGKKSPPKKKK